jgi:hypothetical protein
VRPCARGSSNEYRGNDCRRLVAAELGRAFSLDPTWVRPLKAIIHCAKTLAPTSVGRRGMG